MNLFRKFYCIPSLALQVFAVTRQLATQKKFLLKNIEPILKEARQQPDGSLDDSDFSKINRYYGLAVPAILGEAFCALHGKKMNTRERWASTAQGAMTGLFDDFFDKHYFEGDDISSMLEQAKEPRRSNEKLFDLFYKKALERVPDDQSMKEALQDVHHAQLESKKQVGTELSNDEITRITLLKGGTSLLFYRTAFLPVPTHAEIALLNALGGIMQLSNDIFDVYKDREQQIKTLVTVAIDIADIRRFLEENLRQQYQLARQLGIPQQQAKKCFSILSIGIFSRAFVCLDQLQALQETTGGNFRVWQYDRQQLICDMDRKKNMLQAAAYHVQWMNDYF